MQAILNRRGGVKGSWGARVDDQITDHDVGESPIGGDLMPACVGAAVDALAPETGLDQRWVVGMHNDGADQMIMEPD